MCTVSKLSCGAQAARNGMRSSPCGFRLTGNQRAPNPTCTGPIKRRRFWHGRPADHLIRPRHNVGSRTSPQEAKSMADQAPSRQVILRGLPIITPPSCGDHLVFTFLLRFESCCGRKCSHPGCAFAALRAHGSKHAPHDRTTSM